MSEKNLITLIYKSGVKIHASCETFDAERRSSTLTKLQYVDLEPRPLFIGLDDIAAIFEGHV